MKCKTTTTLYWGKSPIHQTLAHIIQFDSKSYHLALAVMFSSFTSWAPNNGRSPPNERSCILSMDELCFLSLLVMKYVFCRTNIVPTCPFLSIRVHWKPNRAHCPPIYSEENSLQMVAGESIFFNQAVSWSQMTRLWAVLIKC